MANTSYNTPQTPINKGIEAYEVLAKHLVNTSSNTSSSPTLYTRRYMRC